MTGVKSARTLESLALFFASFVEKLGQLDGWILVAFLCKFC